MSRYHIEKIYQGDKKSHELMNDLYCSQTNIVEFKKIYENPENKLTPDTLVMWIDGIVIPLHHAICKDSDTAPSYYIKNIILQEHLKFYRRLVIFLLIVAFILSFQ